MHFTCISSFNENVYLIEGLKLESFTLNAHRTDKENKRFLLLKPLAI